MIIPLKDFRIYTLEFDCKRAGYLNQDIETVAADRTF